MSGNDVHNVMYMDMHIYNHAIMEYRGVDNFFEVEGGAD